MIWAITDFIILLLAMTLTGTLLFAMILFIQKYFIEYVWMRWIYNYMKIIVFFYAAPSIILISHAYTTKTKGKTIFVKGSDFTAATIVNGAETLKNLKSNAIEKYWIFVILFAIWLVGFIYFYFVKLFKNKSILKKIFNNSNICNDETINYLIKKNMEVLNIKRNLCVFKNNRLTSPFLTGVFFPKLYLPNKVLTDSTMELILKHELMHYKSRDLLYKQILGLIHGLYWFNPFINFFVQSFHDFSEIACDESILKGESKKTRKEYAHAIISMLEEDSENSDAIGLSNNNVLCIERRLYYIMKKKTKAKNAVIMILMATVVGACPLTAYAAISSATAIQDGMVRSLINKSSYEEVSSQIDFSTEQTEQTEQKNSTTFTTKSTIKNFATRGSNPIDFEINGKHRLLIESLDFIKGDSAQFVLSGTNTSDKFRAGTINEKGIVKYVSSSNGTIQHTFTIPADGSYDLFIEGTTTANIHIIGSIYLD